MAADTGQTIESGDPANDINLSQEETPGTTACSDSNSGSRSIDIQLSKSNDSLESDTTTITNSNNSSSESKCCSKRDCSSSIPMRSSPVTKNPSRISSSGSSSAIKCSSTSSKRSSGSSTDDSKCLWTEEMQDVMVTVCQRALNYGTRRDLERRVRSGTGTEQKAAQHCCSASSSIHQHQQKRDSSCCSKEHSHHHHGEGAVAGQTEGASAPPVYFFCRGDADAIGKRLDDWTSSERLQSIVGAVCERASKVYKNVVAKGIQDGLTIEKGGPDDRHLHDEILKESLVRELQLRIAQELRQERLLDSREGGLLANPSGYDEGPLSFLSSETIRDLMIDGVAMQQGFIGEEMRKLALKELELLDFDGRFNEVFQQSILDMRKDFMCWTTMSDLDREKEQGLRHLLKCLFALPFELNKKANLCLQVGWVAQLSVFPASGAFYRKHLDGGFAENQNNGRKITAIYYPNPKDWKTEDGGSLLVYRRRSRREQLKDENCLSVPETEKPFKEIAPKADTLVLLRSRDMPHEVTDTFRKRFAISLYMTGPPGPGDDD